MTAITRTDNRIPYMQQWNLTLEREVRPGLSVTGAYVGTKGTFLTIQQYPVNSTVNIPWATLAEARQGYIQTGANPLSQMVTNPFYGTITGNATLSVPTISRQNLALPYPAYAGIVVFQRRTGSSSYHSLQSTVRKSFGRGVELIGSYTWSKNIDYGTSISGAGTGGSAMLSNDNYRLNRSLSGFNQPQRLTVTWLAELPFGRKRKLLSATPVLTQMVSGWKLAGVNTFASGLPIAVTGGTGSFGRPDIIGDSVLPEEYRCKGDGVTACKLPDGSSLVVPRNRMLWFNPRAFTSRTMVTATAAGATTTRIVTDPYWFGTSPRFIDGLRRIWVNNWNMTVSRTFLLREGFRVEFKAEALNAFNRVEWAGPDGAFGGTNTNAGSGLGQSTSTTFGTLDMTANPARTPRYIQLSLRFSF